MKDHQSNHHLHQIENSSYEMFLNGVAALMVSLTRFTENRIQFCLNTKLNFLLVKALFLLKTCMVHILFIVLVTFITLVNQGATESQGA